MRRRRLPLLLVAAWLPAAAADVTVADLVAAIEEQASAAPPSREVRADFARLAREHRLPEDDATLRQYLRVKLVFESVREGGWWRLAWDVTDREPRSDAIWEQWRRQSTSVPLVSATAECDESAALAAFLLRRMGISAGLLWPTSNHTVAVWKVRRADGTEARVVLPTSQVFLEPGDGLGTLAFDAGRQRTVYDYGRVDVPPSTTIPAPLAAFFVASMKAHAGASDATQRALRVLRDRHMDGEAVASVERDRALLAERLPREGAAAEDLAAVAAFERELRGAP